MTERSGDGDEQRAPECPACGTRSEVLWYGEAPEIEDGQDDPTILWECQEDGAVFYQADNGEVTLAGDASDVPSPSAGQCH